MTNRSLNVGLGVATLLGMVASLYMIFMYVPPEQDQGIVQLIFYYHVPLAWDAFASFGLVAIAGIFYLWLGGQIWDDLGRAGAEIGFLFCTIFMVVGSLWAKPIWGTWWTWDSRLTTTFVLWMMYVGYLLMRALIDDSAQVARYSAVIGIAAALDVPVIIVSVRLWRTIHPAVLVTKQGEHGLEDPRMIATLLVALGALTLLFVWFLLLRFAELRMRTRLGNVARAIALVQVRAGDV